MCKWLHLCRSWHLINFFCNGIDFVQITSELIFGRSSTPNDTICSVLESINDDILESEEALFIFLNGTDPPNITIPPDEGMAIVVIMEDQNDCKE